MLRGLAAAALAMSVGLVSAQAQDWGNLDALLLPLSPTGQMEGALWLPDSVVPAKATVALGVVYAHVPGSAGTVSLHAAIYQRSGAGWALKVPVSNLFGFEPREARFFPDRIELQTTTLGPGEPRCCPTLVTYWSVNRSTGAAQRLN